MYICLYYLYMTVERISLFIVKGTSYCISFVCVQKSAVHCCIVLCPHWGPCIQQWRTPEYTAGTVTRFFVCVVRKMGCFFSLSLSLWSLFCTKKCSCLHYHHGIELKWRFIVFISNSVYANFCILSLCSFYSLNLITRLIKQRSPSV